MGQHHSLRLLQTPALYHSPFSTHLNQSKQKGHQKEPRGNGKVAGALRLKGPWAALGLQSPAYLRVYGLVLLQAHRVPEGLAAHLAREWSRAAVGPAHVHLQTVRCGEHLGASGAREKAAEGGLGVWTLEGHGLGAQAQG